MMNNYMDYYNYMNNLNQIADYNEVTSSINGNHIKKMSNTMSDYAEPYIGFTRGNVFNNLYNRV